MTQAIVPKELLTATLGGLSLLVVSGGADGHVLTQQADGTYAPEAVSAGIGGSVGATDNRLVRSDGTGGSTVQSTGITVDDSNNVSGIGTLSVSGMASFSTNVSVSSGVLSGPNLQCGASGYIYWLGRSSIMSKANGTLYATNAAETAGVTLDLTTDAVLKVRTRAASADASLTALDITASGLMRAGVYTFATVPSASSNTGKFLRISDRAQKHAYSDGTDWRFFGDDAIIS